MQVNKRLDHLLIALRSFLYCWAVFIVFAGMVFCAFSWFMCFFFPGCEPLLGCRLVSCSPLSILSGDNFLFSSSVLSIKKKKKSVLHSIKCSFSFLLPMSRFDL